MVSQQEQTTGEFQGAPAEQELARRVYAIMSARGRMFAVNAPIQVSLASLAAFFERDGVTPDQVETAVAANTSVFAVEEINSERVVATTRAGHAPRANAVDVRHTFAQRLMTPAPKPERPLQPRRERPRVAPSWAALPSVLTEFPTEIPLEETAAPEPVEEAAAAAAAAAPAAPVTEAAEAEEAAPPARTITVPAAVPTDVSAVGDAE